MIKSQKYSDHQRLIVPRNALKSKQLTSSHKLFLGLVYALCTERGYCFASNEFFAATFDCENTTPSKWVKKLKDLDFLFVAYRQKQQKVERQIFVDKQLYLRALSSGQVYTDHGKKNNHAVNKSQLSLLDTSCPTEQEGSCPTEQEGSCPTEQQYKESNYKESIKLIYSDLFEIFEEKQSYKVDVNWAKLSDEEQREILEFAPKYISSVDQQYRMLLKNFINPFKKGWRDALVVYNRNKNAKKRENNISERNTGSMAQHSKHQYWGDKTRRKFDNAKTGSEYVTDADLQL